MNPTRLSLSFIVLALLAAGAVSAEAAYKLEYNRDIRPILAENCFPCHGPDSASRQAELRLDQREAAIAMAISPGDPDSSELVRRILSDNPDEQMPPPKTKKTLTPEQKQMLARWIADGAEYQPHWSLIAPKRPEVPHVKNAAWVKNPIDNFIFSKLDSAGLSPADEADRRTLARRACLDITGLPPTPEQVEAFVNDPSPEAYEKFIDALLASEQWGEHRARYWLDYARYADTHGIHFDNFREMWTYRDWVIGAFNRNMPYDQFTIENLAGDLLPNRTIDQQIASGFNRCNMTTNEGGIIDEEYIVLYARERTDTTSQVWMGLTAGCAVCHSHKFDPLSQKEFYELSAFFNNTTQSARDGNIKDTPPIISVPLPGQREKFEELTRETAAARQRLEDHKQDARPAFEAWLETVKPEDLAAKVPADSLHLHAVLDEGEGKVAGIRVGEEEREIALTDSAAWQDGPTGKAIKVQGAACEIADAGDFEGDQPLTATAWVNLPANDGNGAICSRMDNAAAYRGWDFWVQRRQIGMHVIDSWPGNALKVVGQAQVPANQWVHVAVSYDGSRKAAGVKLYYDGQPQATNVENDKLSGSIKTAVPFKIGQRSASEPLIGAVQDLRIYQRVLSPAEVESLARMSKFAGILSKPAEERTDEDKNAVYPFWLGAYDEQFQTLQGLLTKLEQEKAAVQSSGTIAHVMQEKEEAAVAYILNRGEYDQRKDQVSAQTPGWLPPFPADAPRNRLGFAKWLLLPEHPLTARVTVNRFWQEVFGTGLVRTSGDFGVMGEMPSHPELLDWLAVEFRESGWDVKKLFKLMLMSAAYRQAAISTPEKLEKDPQNRLLSRGPRFRMDAEMVRDYALAASGTLVPTIGGPSVKPYQPPGVWEAIAMDVSNTRAYDRGTGDDLYRRGMYTFVKRQAPPASLDIFNAPNREYCVVRRDRTNTALQALVTLNDEQYVEAARRLAEKALKEGGDSFESWLKFISLRLLAREFRPEEVQIVRDSFAELSVFYQQNPEDAKQLIAVGEAKADAALKVEELAAWTMLVNQLMNLDEVLNK